MAFKIPKPTYDAEVVAEIEAYLDQDYLTEITHVEESPDMGLAHLYAAGRVRKSYPRPMFQVIPDGAFSGGGSSVTPCQCDRFDQSWNCELHPDEVAWDNERKRWRLPCTGNRTRCECDSCHERRQGDAYGNSHGPVRRDRLTALSDINFTLETESETEQGAGPLAIEVEPGDGRTD